LQLYITPDPRRDHELGALLDPCNAAFAQYPLLVVPQEWHHVTVQPIAHLPAAQIRDEQRATFIANLGARLAGGAGMDLDDGLAPGQWSCCAARHESRQAVSSAARHGAHGGRGCVRTGAGLLRHESGAH
jgi:hypothetical protein